LHTGIIYLFVSFLLKLFRVKKRPRAIVIAFVLAFYVVLAGMSVSVVRASLMLLCFTFADAFGKGKSADGFNSICIAAVLILLVNPLALFSVSFQLSFAAVASIVLFVPIMEKKVKIRQKIIKKSVVYILLTMVVQIAVAPILAYYFNSFSAVSLFANLLIVPVVSIALICGLLGICFSFVPVIAAAFLRFRVLCCGISFKCPHGWHSFLLPLFM
jgi:competence protein ComEC